MRPSFFTLLPTWEAPGSIQIQWISEGACLQCLADPVCEGSANGWDLLEATEAGRAGLDVRSFTVAASSAGRPS